MPWDGATLAQQEKAVWQEMQVFYELRPSAEANSRLVDMPLLTVNERTIHQAGLVMACVHVAGQVRLPSLVVLLWHLRWSTCWRLCW